MWQTLTIAAGTTVAAVILVLLLFRLLSRPPVDVGVKNGRLASCPLSPNCVCTHDAGAQHGIVPLTFTGNSAEALARLKTVLSRLSRVGIVTERDGYLHAEFRTLLFRYVDDVEFLIDETAKVIHFRSASRAGRSDFGVNRRRMEMIRREFTAACGLAQPGC